MFIHNKEHKRKVIKRETLVHNTLLLSLSVYQEVLVHIGGLISHSSSPSLTSSLDVTSIFTRISPWPLVLSSKQLFSWCWWLSCESQWCPLKPSLWPPKSAGACSPLSQAPPWSSQSWSFPPCARLFPALALHCCGCSALMHPTPWFGWKGHPLDRNLHPPQRCELSLSILVVWIAVLTVFLNSVRNTIIICWLIFLYIKFPISYMAPEAWFNSPLCILHSHIP